MSLIHQIISRPGQAARKPPAREFLVDENNTIGDMMPQEAMQEGDWSPSG